MSDSGGNEIGDSVSRKLKAAVISLTVLTTIAGIIFLVLVFKKVSGSAGGNKWGAQLLIAAERLHKDALIPQAISLYEKFLDTTKSDAETRANVNFTLGELYREQNNCPDALSWFYQIELALPEFSRQNEVNQAIDACKAMIHKKGN